MSMSLRNELRQPLDNLTLYNETYNWETWYGYVQQGASAIHAKNPDVLVFLGGIDSDTTLAPLVQGTALAPGNATFSGAALDAPADKVVLELHHYDFAATEPD